ncbi:MAG TPA: hypothetical protein VIY72_12980 [Acidimicrobiales bacterium]
MTMRTDASWRADLWWYLGLVVASGAAFWIGDGPVAGVLAAGGMLVFTCVLAFGRRRVDALRVIGGAGDERNQQLYLRAVATAGGLLGLVVTGWFLVGVARGEASTELLVLTVIFAVTFVVSSLYESGRS